MLHRLTEFPALLRSMRSLSILPTLMAIVLGACSSSNEPILVGLAGPFSQQHAQSMQLGAQLAVSDINQAGGVRGRELQLVVKDDSGRSDIATQVAESFYDNADIVAVVGHLSSAATLAAARVYNRGANPIVEISPSASSPDITDAGDYTFRICPDDSVHGMQLAEWAYEQLGARRAAILFENDSYGRGLRSSFSNSFLDFGGQVVSEDPFLDVLPSYEPYLTRIRLRGGVDALLIAGGRGGAASILNTLASLAYHPAILSGDAIVGMDPSQADVEGVFVSLAYLPDLSSTLNDAFVAAYHEAYGDLEPDYRGAGAYDIVHLLARAIQEVGTDRSRIRDYLAGVGTETDAFQGVTGRIAFDRNGDVSGKGVVIGVFRDGRIVSALRR
jgi:branched-chain amino acid transport system substrate-binding protein